MTIRGSLGGVDVEPDTVVLDDDIEPASLVPERYDDERGLRMPPSVGERFLDDPIEEEARYPGWFRREFVRDLETGGSAELRPSIEVRTDRCDEALIVQDARVQLEHHVGWD